LKDISNGTITAYRYDQISFLTGCFGHGYRFFFAAGRIQAFSW